MLVYGRVCDGASVSVTRWSLIWHSGWWDTLILLILLLLAAAAAAASPGECR